MTTDVSAGPTFAAGRPVVAPLPGLRLAVPAYAHPVAAPQLWERLADAAEVLRLVIVNPHDGPGAAPDPAYPPVMAALRDAGVRLVGYVDTAYAQRPVADVVADVQTWVARYGVHAVFLDQVSSGLADLEHYAQLVNQVRAAGARFVALNPGVHPHPGYLDLANLTVTFEGAWEDYRELAVPDWTARYPAARLCHLVHGVPAPELEHALALAATRHVEAVMVTDGTGANPWDDVPPAVVETLQRSRSAAPPAGAGPARSRPAVAAPALRRPRTPRLGLLLAAAATLVDGAALAAAGRPWLPGLRLLLVVLLGAAAAAALAVPLRRSLRRRDLRLLGAAYHLCGTAALALAAGPRLALGGAALAGAGAALLAPSLARLAVPPRRR